MLLKKGIQIKVISGKDKGKTGEILEINRRLNNPILKNFKLLLNKHVKITKIKKKNNILWA